MIVSFARAGAWLLVQAAQFPDTVLMRQVGNERGWFETATALAGGLMSIALLVLTVALVPAAWNFRKSYAKVSDLLDRVYGDINPLMRHASAIADNVNYISTSIRTDIQQVNATIATASTVRGVRTGAAALHTEDEDAPSATGPTPEEHDDGYIDPDEPEAGATRPRVRPRRRDWA